MSKHLADGHFGKKCEGKQKLWQKQVRDDFSEVLLLVVMIIIIFTYIYIDDCVDMSGQDMS